MGRIVARIQKVPMMVYGSMQTESMETKHDDHIHGFRTLIICSISI